MRGFFLIFLLFIGVAQASDAKKAVFDLTTSNIDTIETRLIKGVALNNAYYQDKFQDLDIIVIIHGDAYKFFVKDLSKTKISQDASSKKITKELHQRLASLANTYSIKFEMCEAGMKSRGVKKDNILEFIHPITSAMMGLIDAQNSGYAYIPLN